MLKRLFFAVLLVVLLPLCAHAAQESRMTPELAEKVLLECRRGDTFQILKGYDFTHEEYEQMKMYLRDWKKYPMQDPDMGHDGESRFTLETILSDILGNIQYDNIFECSYITFREEYSSVYNYYIVRTDNGKKIELYVEYDNVILDPRIATVSLEKNSRLKVYVKRINPHILQAVKIMLLPPDDGYISTCKENDICDPRIFDGQIMELRRILSKK